MDDRAMARWRLHTLRLAGRPYDSVEDVVGGLLGVQAENHPQASWAVATRTSGTNETAFGACFDGGSILRTHVLRPTWHFVRPDDIRWLIELTAPRVRRSFRQVQRDLELGDDVFAVSREVIVDALAGGVHHTRDALGERLREAGLPAEGQRLGLLVADAELTALVCSGAVRDGVHTYALLEERVPEARTRDPNEALAELVLRYFTGHGPATERDLAYWASMTLTDVRAGLAAVSERLVRVEHDGRTFWSGQEPPDDDRTLEPRAHLLQILDEYHNGYQDSRSLLDVEGIVPRGRAASVGMVLVDGQMVGGMRRTVAAEHVTFAVSPFRDLARDEVEAVHAAAARYGAFLDREPRVTGVG